MDWLTDKRKKENGLFKEKWILAEQLIIGAAKKQYWAKKVFGERKPPPEEYQTGK